MCLLKEYRRYISNVHIHEKDRFTNMNIHIGKSINVKSVQMRLKILNDIHNEKIHIGLVLLFKMLFHLEIKYNSFNKNYVFYLMNITNLSKFDTALHHLIMSLYSLHRYNYHYIQDSIFSQWSLHFSSLNNYHINSYFRDLINTNIFFSIDIVFMDNSFNQNYTYFYNRIFLSHTYINV